MTRKGTLFAASALVAALATWISVAAVSVDVPRAHAQEQGDAVEIRRTQDAAFLPAERNADPLFVLAIGSDARPGVCMPVPRCLADSVHVVAVNTKKRAATILGIPRDSYVEIPGVGMGKINNALSAGGPELVVETVESLIGIEIDFYMLASFEGLIGMVDEVGGISVDVPYPMNDAASGTNFEAGVQRLRGIEALRFSRDRKSVPNGDFSRSENQGLLIQSALTELREDFGSNPVTLFSWVLAGLRHVSTDLSFVEIFDLMVTALSIKPEKVTNAVVPGGLGFAGDASIVTLGDAAEAVFKDLRKDGVLKAAKP